MFALLPRGLRNPLGRHIHGHAHQRQPVFSGLTDGHVLADPNDAAILLDVVKHLLVTRLAPEHGVSAQVIHPGPVRHPVHGPDGAVRFGAGFATEPLVEQGRLRADNPFPIGQDRDARLYLHACLPEQTVGTPEQLLQALLARLPGLL